MKKRNSLWLALPFALLACNNEGKDSVEKADSANEAKQEMANDNNMPGAAIDNESSDFLVKAADGGMAEVELGKMAQQKATNAKVKEFAAMMVTDHTGANADVKSLAASKNVTLPAAVSDEHKSTADNLSKKSGAEFDKDYMDAMVKDHQKTVDLFEDAANDAKDADVKALAAKTLPKLRAHLDQAKAIQSSLK